MEKMTIKQKLVSITTFAVSVMSLFAFSQQTKAETINIYKVENDSQPTYVNKGYEKPAELAGANPLAGAGFSIYDLTKDFYETFLPNYQAAHAGATTPDGYNAYVEALRHESNGQIEARGGGTAVATSGLTAADTGLTTVNGLARQSQTTSGLKNAIYAVVETTRPAASHNGASGTEKATKVIGSIPTIVSLPMYAADGVTPLDTIDIYPKNEMGTLTKTIQPVDNHVEKGQTIFYTITIKLPNDLAKQLTTGTTNINKFKYASFTVNEIPGVGLTFKEFTVVQVGGNASQSLANFITSYNVTAPSPAELVGNGISKASLVIAPISATYSAGSKWEELAGQTLTFKVKGEVNAQAQVDNKIPNKANYKVTEANGYEAVPEEAEVFSLTHKYIFQKNDIATGQALIGAEFQVKIGSGSPISFIKVSDGVYKIASPNDSAGEKIQTLKVSSTGTLELQGLDSDVTYSLVEITAPTGYRLPVNPITTFKPAEHDSANTCENFDDDDDLNLGGNKTDGFHNIYNTPDTILPNTGGAGFKAFLIVAISSLALAIALFITKKRIKKTV